jgi:molybdate transport system substrate-binding protein
MLVYAAASLTDVLGELSNAWQRHSGIAVRCSFASSAVLARQIEAGARADVFIPADQEWMDYLEARQLLDVTTRRDLAGNRLVLIAPADSQVKLRIAPDFALAAALAGGRLATADPATVPAGRYARAALESLGVWSAVEHRLARADNVRGALMFVARGEAPLGIVYATDARLDRNVRIVDTFPADSHAPIRYPAAVLAGARRESVEFVRFLAGAEARAIWYRHGFVAID